MLLSEEKQEKLFASTVGVMYSGSLDDVKRHVSIVNDYLRKGMISHSVISNILYNLDFLHSSENMEYVVNNIEGQDESEKQVRIWKLKYYKIDKGSISECEELINSYIEHSSKNNYHNFEIFAMMFNLCNKLNNVELRNKLSDLLQGDADEY